MDKQLQKLLKKNSGIHLDIGCGFNKQPGFVGIDYRPIPGIVDVVQDLETFPWPLPDECARMAIASHVVEHINPAKGIFISFMDEVWRLLKPEGEFGIVTPYAGSPGYWQDPSHVNGCTEATFRYFDPLDKPTRGELYKIYKPKPWKIKEGTLSLKRTGNLELVLIKRLEDPSYYA